MSIYFLSSLAPSLPPTIFKLIIASSTSVKLWIRPPTSLHQNGIIKRYTIIYHSIQNEYVNFTVSLILDSSAYPQTENQSLLVESLKTQTNYSIQIQAVTISSGPFSDPIYHYTTLLGNDSILIQDTHRIKLSGFDLLWGSSLRKILTHSTQL